MKTYFAAIHTPNYSTANSPSAEFSAYGYVGKKEADNLERELSGFLSTIVFFNDKEEFEETMREFDREYWERRM